LRTFSVDSQSQVSSKSERMSSDFEQ